MKTAKVGTIMPWGGDGFSGFGAGNIPKGWELCDGEVRDASQYPLLASVLGTTYGGTITGIFPNYSGTFVVPNISNRVMIDLEKDHLALPEFQYGQGDVLNTVIDSAGTKFGDLISDFGTTQVIKTIWSANADIDFTLPAGLTLVGKYTQLGITDPDFQTSVTTLNRKLGINHTPAHSHADSILTASASFIGPAVFTSAQVQASGNTAHPNCPQIASKNHTCDLLPSANQAPSWQGGRTLCAYYGDEQYENTLPYMDKFQDFVNDAGKDYWSKVPATDWHSGTPTRNSPQAPSQSYNFTDTKGFTSTFPTVPIKTHAIPAWTGLIPKPQIFGARRNFYGKETGSTYQGVTDNPEDSTKWFSVSNVNVGNGVTEFTLPAGTDIRTSKTESGVTFYAYDKVRPYKLVDGTPFAKGTYITEVTRAGTSDANYVYTIKLSLPTIAAAVATTVTFKEGTFGTTLSNTGDNNPNNISFISHNHGSFDIQMSRGSLNPPATHPVPSISIGSVSPDNLNDALNIIVDTSQPAMNIVYLIKAY